MKVNQKTVVFISGLVITAMIGLISVQIILLIQSYRFKEEIFVQNVNRMLSSVIQKLETQETLNQVLSVSVGIDSQGGYSAKMHVTDQKHDGESAFALKNIRQSRSEVGFDSNKVVIHLREQSLIRLVVLDSTKKVEKEVYASTKPPGIHQIPIDHLAEPQMVHFILYINDIKYPFYLDKSSPGRLIIDPELDRSRAALIHSVVNQYMRFEPFPIQERLDFAFLDSVVQVTMKEFGIHTAAHYGILNSKSDSLVFQSTALDADQLKSSKYRSRLFPHDLFVESNDLVFTFPDERMHLIKQLSLSSILALGFLVTLLVCFLFIIRTLWSQKRFSQLLVDFINNMTHEFKTPISTIALASETISRDKILQDKKRLVNYSRIIQDESHRMRKQVENILEMTALEKGEIDLQMENVSLHDILNQAVDHFRLIVEKQKGKINLNLNASTDQIVADGMYLMNVIHNMFDNAVKYTEHPVQIMVTTSNQDNHIHVRIKDNGLGIDAGQQKRIFDKYYRVPTGNLHNVKGFGLGLHYVRLIVEAHLGSVDVESKPGEGSIFTIKLPLKENP
jgi:two-component system phosphate regulon sensor histidine kinase PhoR